jgi:hypothetical protein
MNFNEDPPDPFSDPAEITSWLASARAELRQKSIEKGLLYSYDFTKDQPIQNAYSRLIWDITPIISPKPVHFRSSSTSQARYSSLSTNVAMDFEFPEDLPVCFPGVIQISDPLPRGSQNFCLRQRKGSGQLNDYSSSVFSRSKSY